VIGCKFAGGTVSGGRKDNGEKWRTNHVSLRKKFVGCASGGGGVKEGEGIRNSQVPSREKKES